MCMRAHVSAKYCKFKEIPFLIKETCRKWKHNFPKFISYKKVCTHIFIVCLTYFMKVKYLFAD